MSQASRDLLGSAGPLSTALTRTAVPRRAGTAARVVRPTPGAGRLLRIVAGGSARVSPLGCFERVDASGRIAWFGETR